MDKSYSSKEIAEILNVSDKSVRRYLNSYFSIEKGAYKVSEKMLNLLKIEYLGQNSDIDVQSYERIEYFTEEEYQEFHKRLVEYSNLKEQLEYHKKSSENHSRQMDIILNIMQQRNFIEATEKRIEDK
jgi:predicted transcriptional regulator